MRIRNKKTGEIVDWEHGLQYKLGKEYQSVKEFAEDWEDAPGEDKPWRPVEDEFYWYINDYGSVDFTSFSNCSLVDRTRLALGNCFRTKEEALKAVEWLKARKVLLDDAKGFNPAKTDSGWEVYWFVYVHGDGLIGTDWRAGWFVNGDSLISFPTREAAQASIDKHGREWKIYLGVED